jgi:hypothetical protein
MTARITLPPPNAKPGTLSAAEYREMAEKPRRSKYNVGRSKEDIAARTMDGIVFDSAAECRRYGQLKLLEKSGFIKRMELQPKFEFELNGRKIFSYLADFRYHEGQSIKVEDVKSKPTKTAVYRLKKKIIEEVYSIDIIEVC